MLKDVLRHATDLHQSGHLHEAEGLYKRILQEDPTHFDALNRLAIVALQRGDLKEALSRIELALRVNPDSASALSNKASILLSLNNHPEALLIYDRVIALKPDDPDAHYNRARALQGLNRHLEALTSYDRVVALKPDDAEAYFNRGSALFELNRLDEALASYEAAIGLQPSSEFYVNHGNVLRLLKRHELALASYDRALRLKPNSAETLYNLGNALLDLKRPEDALASYDRALALRRDYAEAYCNRGNALLDLRRPDKALASYDRALALKPDYPEALSNRGNAQLDLRHPEEALVSFERALTLKPDYAEALSNRGNALLDLHRPEEALSSYDQALTADPENFTAFGGYAYAASFCCDWKREAWIAQKLNQLVANGDSVSPFVMLVYSKDPTIQWKAARNYIQDRVPPRQVPLFQGPPYRHKTIRVAYLSADFRMHATSCLTAGLFAPHDRDRFEITAISFGKDDRSPMRNRIEKAFDHFHDVSSMSDGDTARLLREAEIDIAVDLNGHTKDGRPEILSFRPAPVQVSYLGYPGTMGAEFIDYVIADATVLPLQQRTYFTEKIVHLPDCYQVNDGKRDIAATTPTRRAEGLPEAGFVFCCFNNNYKITPEVFSIWMRLLTQLEGSVLWLLRDNDAAQRNLCREAEARGVASSRLVFARRQSVEQHLARHRLADLFLDTLPYNAHTTASDALWVGLPIVTCMGETFPARVAASLLRAIGLPELVTNSLPEYEQLARHLASLPGELAAIRTRLQQNRLAFPLFDTDRFARNLEAAYVRMWERSEAGLPPESFSVPPRSRLSH